jgi:hypothetical protein
MGRRGEDTDAKCQLTLFWMPLRMADMTADSGNGSFGLADDFWLYVTSAMIACG